jgi:hypothetical protein
VSCFSPKRILCISFLTWVLLTSLPFLKLLLYHILYNTRGQGFKELITQNGPWRTATQLFPEATEYHFRPNLGFLLPFFIKRFSSCLVLKLSNNIFPFRTIYQRVCKVESIRKSEGAAHFCQLLDQRYNILLIMGNWSFHPTVL